MNESEQIVRVGSKANQEAVINHLDSLDFKELREINAQRKKRWHGEDADWSIADWSNAMCGEAGETANIVKKIRRHETGVGSSYNTPEMEPLLMKLAGEIADTIIYADLLANHAGIDLAKAIREKFNYVSEKNEFPERL